MLDFRVSLSYTPFILTKEVTSNRVQDWKQGKGSGKSCVYYAREELVYYGRGAWRQASTMRDDFASIYT